MPSIHEEAYCKGMARSGQWRALEEKVIKEHPYCSWCGTRDRLQVHHLLPFADNPAHELDPENCIVLCEFAEMDCHLRVGHLGNFHTFNPKAKEMANSKGPGFHAEQYTLEVPAHIRPVLQAAPGTVIK